MGTSKTLAFTARENNIARYARALAHPARIAILQLLLKKQTCICGDIVGELPLSQSTVSQHLKVLKAAGLIQGKISGVSTCYCLNPKAWEQAGLLLGKLLGTRAPVNSCC